MVLPRGRPTLLHLCSHPARVNQIAATLILPLTTLIMVGGIILGQGSTRLSAYYFAIVWCGRPLIRNWISPIFSMARGRPPWGGDGFFHGPHCPIHEVDHTTSGDSLISFPATWTYETAPLVCLSSCPCFARDVEP